jgi:cytochrome c
MALLLGCMSAVSPMHADEAVEYGAYLSGECVTCHRTDASSGAIPVLAGRNSQEILTALAAFKSGERASPVMRDIAARLAEDEMSALAAYFSSLPAPPGCKEASSPQKQPC